MRKAKSKKKIKNKKLTCVKFMIIQVFYIYNKINVYCKHIYNLLYVSSILISIVHLLQLSHIILLWTCGAIAHH